ncbi:MAG TPA: hypothetical protein EYP28_06455 [Methanophagales archaeon]|nr:hypothetical protein [Methanophagales archaeon]
MNRKLKDMLKRGFLSIHKLGIHFGIHILPVHYYSPIPNILELEKTKDIWAKKSELPGIKADLNEQCDNLKTICLPYQHEYFGNKVYLEGVSQHFGPGYGYIEAQALYAVIRYYKPKKVIEVGSGVSTYCMLAALEKNREEVGKDYQLISIEPYPSGKLKELAQEHKIKLISQKSANCAI